MIRGIFYIEAQGNNKELVGNSLNELSSKLHRESKLIVKKEHFGGVIEENKNFSSTLEVELEFQDFLSYVMTAIQYGPSAIEIMEPEKLVLSSKEFLDAIGEIIKISKMMYGKYKVGFKFPKRDEKKTGLTEEEVEELLDQGALRVKIVVEGRGKTRKEAVKNLLQTISEDVFVNKLKSKKVESESPFSGVVGFDALMYEAKTLVDIAVKHTPVLIEIIEPEEIELSMFELQDVGVELAGLFLEMSISLSRPTGKYTPPSNVCP